MRTKAGRPAVRHSSGATKCKIRISHDRYQEIFKFENGYGASVITGNGTYGGDRGLYELAVIKFGEDYDWDWRITYDTPITEDVVGFLTSKDVEDLLVQIEALQTVFIA
jgi:hypothetical protein